MLLTADIISDSCTRIVSLSRTIKIGDTLLGIAFFVFYRRECEGRIRLAANLGHFPRFA